MRALRLPRGLKLLVFVSVLAGCGKEQSQPPAATPFGEHRVAEFKGTARKQLGEDCTHFGAAECSSGLCLHTGTSPNSGYVCSRACDSGRECPSGWRCAQAGLTGGPAYCVRAGVQGGQQ